eukprot:353584-Chlamydomonas_euryale.AAC.3
MRPWLNVRRAPSQGHRRRLAPPAVLLSAPRRPRGGARPQARLPCTPAAAGRGAHAAAAAAAIGGRAAATAGSAHTTARARKDTTGTTTDTTAATRAGTAPAPEQAKSAAAAAAAAASAAAGTTTAAAAGAAEAAAAAAATMSAAQVPAWPARRRNGAGGSCGRTRVARRPRPGDAHACTRLSTLHTVCVHEV